MFTQTKRTFVMVSQQAEEIMNLGRSHHWWFRIILDFQGVITGLPVYSLDGTCRYNPLSEEDRMIIPKRAYIRHAAVTKAGYRVAQVVIGHEVKPGPDEPQEFIAPPASTSEIDWANVAEVAGKGLLVGMMGVAIVSITTLIGVLRLVDPSYCIVLDDDQGTVIELIRWNTEVKNGTNPFTR